MAMAMAMATHVPATTTWSILATDIDTEVLSFARNGVFPISKKQEIPDEYLNYINIGKKKSAGWFKVSDQLHQHIQFEQHNLIEKENVSDQKYDLVLCRNVMIYFERKTIHNLMNKLHQSLQPDGYLFIGHSESIQGTQKLFNPLEPAIFKKVAG